MSARWLAAMALVCAQPIASTAPAGRQAVPQQPAANAAIADPEQLAVEPALESAVRRFFATQEAEDVDAYLALWSPARKPSADQLKFVFQAGDDRFSDIAIVRVARTDRGARVRVTGVRDRSIANPLGTVSTLRGRFDVSLAFALEAGEWKLLSEGPAADDLAAAILDAQTPEARDELLAADPDMVTVRLVEALSRRGAERTQARHYPEAQAAFERTLEIARRIGNRKAEGEALQNLANAFYFQRNYPRALEGYEQRLAVERGRQDQEAAANALSGMATVRYSVADYAVALANYREALAIQEALHSQSNIATTLISTGNIQYLLGDYPAAIADYQRSRDIHKGMSDTAGEAAALGGLGRVLVAQGNLAAALDAFSAVLAEARAGTSRTAQGTALMNIGDVHYRLGTFLLHARRSRKAGPTSRPEGKRPAPGVSGRRSPAWIWRSATIRWPNASTERAPQRAVAPATASAWPVQPWAWASH